MTDDSHIVVDDRTGKCTSFVGHDAVSYVRAEYLASGLKLYVSSGGRIIPTRGMGVMRMLAMATEITKKKYKRTEATQAADDVRKWAQEMKAALPQERR